MTEVESIEEKQREKHEGRFTSEQYRAWAHLIQLKKHDSLDPTNLFGEVVARKQHHKVVLQVPLQVPLIHAYHLANALRFVASVLTSCQSGTAYWKRELYLVMSMKKCSNLLWLMLRSFRFSYITIAIHASLYGCTNYCYRI